MNAIRKLGSVIVVVLALNFLGMAVAAAMLAQRAGLNREKIVQMKEILFPPAEQAQPDAKAKESEPPPAPPTPMEQLIALLDEQAGKPTEERVEDMRRTFDQRTAIITRQERELRDRRRQLDLATQELLEARAAYQTSKQAWEAQVQAAAERAKDQGFREALALYEQMPADQVKAVFLKLDNQTILSFLRAMEPRAAAKILEEFQGDQELTKVKEILELMRQGDAAMAAAEMKDAAANQMPGQAPPGGGA